MSTSLPLSGLGSSPATTIGRRGALLAALLLAGVIGIGCGAMWLSPVEVAAALWHAISGAAYAPHDGIVLGLRLPRVLLAAAVGAGLAVSGATMQGLFRNPLVEPGLVGISAGAALGAISMIVLGGSTWLAAVPWLAMSGVSLAAFVGAVLATLLVYALGRGLSGVSGLLLAGVAINAMAMAGVGLLTYLADERQLRDLSFWSLGSLSASDWPHVWMVVPVECLAVLLLPRRAAALNALLLGEADAQLLGFSPRRLRAELIALVALATGTAVACCGVIGFVGLLVPHVMRMVVGADHRALLPASALAGGSLLILADTAARCIVAPAELPVGIITALLGAPFFLWLLFKARRRGEWL
ncbi:FecCD family ABC transporter permease [Frateuria aurantia]